MFFQLGGPNQLGMAGNYQYSRIQTVVETPKIACTSPGKTQTGPSPGGFSPRVQGLRAPSAFKPPSLTQLRPLHISSHWNTTQQTKLLLRNHPAAARTTHASDHEQAMLALEQILKMFAPDQALLIILFVVVFLIRLSFQTLRVLAWNHAKASKKRDGPRQIFAGSAPGWFHAGVHYQVVNLPTFTCRAVIFFLFSLPSRLISATTQLLWNGRPSKIEDEHVFDFVMNTSLVLLVRVSDDVLLADIRIPQELPLSQHYPDHSVCSGLNYPPEGLHVAFDVRTKTILRAETQGREVQGQNHITRNEILMCAFLTTLSQWLHPVSHVAAEKSAREIAEKQVEMLEPSSRFVESLHEGLLHGWLSPIARMDHPLHSGWDVDLLLETMKLHPTPPHKLVSRKAEIAPVFRFYREANRVVSLLIKTYGLGVNPEWLFLNAVLHSVDRYETYKALAAIPGTWSLDGTGSLRSYFKHLVFTFFWLEASTNPFEPEYVRDLSGIPFYRDLYDALEFVDAERANQMLSSCSF
eukprot:3000286-Rhodomonas_salina.1